MIRAYYATVSFADKQVGRVLSALRKLGLDRNTVVVLTSDHGFHLGEKGRWSKHGSLYDPVLRVPLVVSLPGTDAAGQVSSRTVELVDLFPTLLEVAGIPVPDAIDGQSFTRLLDDPQAAWDHPAYSFARTGGTIARSVRTERYRYTEWPSPELIDYTADPHEVHNAALDGRRAETVRELRRLLERVRVLPN
jgi:arylsulfatase A-like enzyme